MEIVYTFGYKPSYDKYLKDNENPCIKLGKGSKPEGYAYEGEYPGGTVVRTLEEALECKKQFSFYNYEIYKLLLPNSWEEDVYLREDGTYSILLDCQFKGLDDDF